jgi:hypothetical protein
MDPHVWSMGFDPGQCRVNVKLVGQSLRGII